jgi:hypothetical protein
MNDYSKLILVAAILIALGVTIVSTSSLRIFFVKSETIPPTSAVLQIQANSTSDPFTFWNLYGALPKSEQIFVVVSESPYLQNLLNSALNYSATMDYRDNITITVGNGGQNISATERPMSSSTYQGFAVAHLFDIPSDWWLYGVYVTNPENHPVCWVITVVLYGHVVDNSWRAALIIGIASVILGVATVGIANNRRKRIEARSSSKV